MNSVVTIILAILIFMLIFLMFSSSRDNYNRKKWRQDIANTIKFEDIVIKEFVNYVNIKTVSGDVFKKITMEEYDTIDDPMKTGSYRIHRKAIESEYHFSEGAGYLNIDGKQLKVIIHGDEYKQIKTIKLYSNHYKNDVLKGHDIEFTIKDNKITQVDFEFGIFEYEQYIIE